jgi:Kef-type K+ transport system membrane component KefB
MANRLRVLAFAILTPFYFIKAGSLIKFNVIITSLLLIVVLLATKMFSKMVTIYPATKAFKFKKVEGVYTTLLMSTGLTFGTISALFGLSNHIINQDQYTVLVTVVILSAVVPTLIAQRWFRPDR